MAEEASGHGEIVKQVDLFGGNRSWVASDWTASDDRVRGGNSHSYLDTSSSPARFHGTLDIETLGGAGFASQRTTTTDTTWDLSAYSGILLDLGDGDDKSYTLILKDTLLPRNSSNGREQASISYEYDFCLADASSHSDSDSNPSKSKTIFIPWHKFKPTYRGKDKNDAPPLDTKNIKRFSIMMRSFFGTQHGPFDLSLYSISAITFARTSTNPTTTTTLVNPTSTDSDTVHEKPFPYPYHDDPSSSISDDPEMQKEHENQTNTHTARSGLVSILGVIAANITAMLRSVTSLVQQAWTRIRMVF